MVIWMQLPSIGKDIIIEPQGKKIPNLLLWVDDVAVIRLGGTGIKAMSGQTRASPSHAYGADAPEVQPG